MHLSRLAWQCVSAATIERCWNHTGIFGHITVQDAAENDKPLEKQIDRLQSVGLLKASNRMAISELLNSAGESECSMWTTEEIFRSVKDARTEEEDDDDDNKTDELHPRPKPTAKEVFKAISLINDYIESETSEAADKLNQTMETYSKQLVDHLITNSQQTTITSFFQPADSQ
ncbi:hypothetical protein PSHT_15781 [Puccinia striiformis]|uniref:Uncharacterized protein n=1 Tax=Puccinia striiformis TaxID=27350 RepID=A0A2S4UD21_9BASI|nr:hypothetical protein PSHT_15781 [Puccinia striiformis]